jgi:Peroxidase, family 2
MLLALATVAVLSTTAVVAIPVGQWAPPGPGDLRGPCPGLNTLANHGYLPRNGSGIAWESVLAASQTAFGVGKDVVGLGTLNAAIKAHVFPGGFLPSLAALNLTHNVLEHDASLTRTDKDLGDFVTLNATLLKMWFPQGASSPAVDPEALAGWRAMRILHSQRDNPTFTWKLSNQQPISATESAFLTTIFGKWNLLHIPPTVGEIPAKYLVDFFTSERLPTAQGWRKRKLTIHLPEFLTISEYFLTKELSARGMSDASASSHAKRILQEWGHS